MRHYSWSSNRMLALLFAALNLAVSAAIYAGPGRDFRRQELMGNSGLTIFREADFGNFLYLGIYIDGIPITSLGRGEGYRAIIRPGPHTLSVTDGPSMYGKTKFTHRRIHFRAGENYSFTAVWEVETILLETSVEADLRRGVLH